MSKPTKKGRCEVKPCQCYRFDSCYASVCPLEPEVGHYLSGEATCLIARRIASGRSKGDELHEAVAAGMPRVVERHPRIGTVWNRAVLDLERLRGLHGRGRPSNPDYDHPDRLPAGPGEP